jgi:hypothetical protein
MSYLNISRVRLAHSPRSGTLGPGGEDWMLGFVRLYVHIVRSEQCQQIGSAAVVPPTPREFTKTGALK